MDSSAAFAPALQSKSLQITDVALVDGNDNPVASPVLVNSADNQRSAPFIGQEVFIKADWRTTGLSASDQYVVDFTVDGITLASETISGQSGTSVSESTFVGGWYASPGSHSVNVTVDAQHAVQGADETSTLINFTYTPVVPAGLPVKLADPLGTTNRDFTIVGYADVNPATGTATDYNGGSITTDGNAALDLRLANFAAMDNGFSVFAAASGTVMAVQDGNFDRQTSLNPAAPGNYVEIALTDSSGNPTGWETLYGGLADNTITVNVGDKVTVGEVIGLVGSSGSSVAPQLQFQLLYNNANVETNYDASDYWVAPFSYETSAPITLMDVGLSNYDPTSELNASERPVTASSYTISRSGTLDYWFTPNYLTPNDTVEVDWYPPGATSPTVSSFYTAPGVQINQPLVFPHADTWTQGTWQVAVLIDGQLLNDTNFVMTTLSTSPAAVVTQNGSDITDGRTTPVDFGSVAQGANAIQQTFTVANVGDATLALGKLSLPPNFSLVGNFPPTVAPGSTANFTLQLNTGVVGSQFGQVSFTTNNSNQAVFTFNVTGTVTGTVGANNPVITLSGAAALFNPVVGPVLLDPSATVSASPSDTWTNGTLKVQMAAGQSSIDHLAIQNVGNAAGQIAINQGTVYYGGTSIGTYSGGDNLTPLLVTFNNSATTAAVQALVDDVLYRSDLPLSLVPRSVRLTLVDNKGDTSNLAIKTVVMNPGLPAVDVSTQTLSIAANTAGTTYTVVLASQPTASVSVSLAPQIPLATQPTSLTFTTANWNVPQTVTVTAGSNNPPSAVIRATAGSTDPDYQNIAVPQVSVAISSGIPSQLVITGEPPATVAAGAPFGLTVVVEDSAGNVITNYSGNLAVALAANPGGSVLGGTTSVAVQNGSAVFTNLNLNKVATGYTLTVSGTNFPSLTTTTIAVVPATASQITITGQPPAQITATAPFSMTADVLDADGNLVTGYSRSLSVGLSTNPGGGTLNGTQTVAVSGGIATFTGLSISTPGNGYVIAVTGNSLTTANSSAINVTPIGTAVQLAMFVQPPSSTTAGANFGLTVEAEDSLGNLATSYIGSASLSVLSSPGGSTVSGAMTEPFLGGYATFSGLSADKVGIYSFELSSSTLLPTTTSNMTVTPGAATQLVVTSGPPSGVTALTPFTMTVSAEDAEGNIATGYAGNVAVALGSNPGGSTLGGTLSEPLVNGSAVFSDLTLDKRGSGYTLLASSPGLTSALSNDVAVAGDVIDIQATGIRSNLTVSFTDPTDFTLTYNGTSTNYSTTTTGRVIFNVASGTIATATFVDPTNVYTANASFNATQVISSLFEFDAVNVSTLYVYAAHGSSAQVSVANSSGGDNFYVDDAVHGYSYIADPGDGIYSELVGFPIQTVTGSQGTTYAYLYSAPGAVVVGDPANTTLSVGSQSMSLGSFAQLYVVGAADGSDQVTLDSAGGAFVGTPKFSYVHGTYNANNFFIGALYAANLSAAASQSGTDQAFFVSYPNNAFSGSPGSGTLTGTATNDSTNTNYNFSAQAGGFRSIAVFESGGGTDTVSLFAPSNTQFVGMSTVSTLTSGLYTVTIDTFVTAKDGSLVPGASQITVTGSQVATDIATLYDSPGANTLVAAGSTATLKTANGTLAVSDFGNVDAVAGNGSSDVLSESAIDFALETSGNWTRS